MLFIIYRTGYPAARDGPDPTRTREAGVTLTIANWPRPGVVSATFFTNEVDACGREFSRRSERERQPRLPLTAIAVYRGTRNRCAFS